MATSDSSPEPSSAQAAPAAPDAIPDEQVAPAPDGDAVVEAPVAPAVAVAAPDDTERGFLDSLDDLGADADDVEPREHRVVAVLVAHDGERWLPATLTALARLTRRPDRTVLVDTGSTDTSPIMLQRAVEIGLADRVVTVERDAGFGAAVAAGLQAGSGTAEPLPADVQDWVWLLHDDSAPASTALEELLRTSDRTPSARVLGPKQRGWNNTDVLVEVGVTVARSGARVTGLEQRELDQGQHDGLLDVMAVGSAGMLVARSVWDELGGFDPAYPVFRDDLDFCWRAQNAGHRVVVATGSVVHHREAATHGRRAVTAGSPKHGDRPHRLDRAAALHLMRAHAAGLGRVLVTLRLVVGSLLRALGFLLGKVPDRARDEWGALRDALGHRSSLTSSRSRVHASRSLPTSVPESDVRALLASRTAQLRHGLDWLADLLAGRESADAGRSSSLLEATVDDPYGWYVDDTQPSRLRRWLTRPGVLMTLGLLVCTLVGARALLGSGVLVGGALLPAPDGAGDLWASYLAAWHEVGPGSAQDAPAWLVPLSALAMVLRGSASAANDVVLLGVIPLGGVAAYLALRGVVGSTWVRVWAAVTYATLPAVTGALSGGRLGTSVAVVLLPWLARSAARLVGVGGRPGTWRRAFGTALLLAVVASFVPVVWILGVLLAVAAGVLVVRDPGGRLRLAVTVLLPVALLVPWSLRVVRQPALLWLEPGLVGPGNAHLTALDVILLRPGGTGSTPLWLGVGLVVAGVVALAVPAGRRPVVAAWSVGLVALLVGSVETVLRVTPPPLTSAVTPWPGVPTLVWGGALILCSAVTIDRVVPRLARASFGWRQPAAVVLGILLVLAPVCSLALVVIGVDGPIHRDRRDAVPAFVAAEMRTSARYRALVLERGPAQAIVYDLLAAPAPQTGDIDVAPDASVYAGLDRVVAQLTAGLGGNEADGLASRGIGFVILSDVAGRDDPLVPVLDGERGLRRLSGQSGAAVWQITSVATRAQVVDPPPSVEQGTVATRVAHALPVSPLDPREPAVLAAPVAAGPAGRRAVLSETLDSRWRWTVGDQGVSADPLTEAASATGATPPDPAVQQVTLPAGSVGVAAQFDGSSRTAWLWAQAAVLLVTLVLALPSRRAEEDDDADGDAELGAESLALPAATPPGAVAPADPDPAVAAEPEPGSEPEPEPGSEPEPEPGSEPEPQVEVEEPAVQEPVAEEPVAEEPVADGPAVDEAPTRRSARSAAPASAASGSVVVDPVSADPATLPPVPGDEHPEEAPR